MLSVAQAPALEFKEKNPASIVNCNIDCSFFQAKLSSGNLLDVAQTIASAYLVAGSGGSKNANRRRAPSLIRFASHTSGELEVLN